MTHFIVLDYDLKCISTHTLTWSVTPNNYTDKIDLNISTHTLTWSVTPMNPSEYRGRLFQLTRSRGAWRCWKTFRRLGFYFNSHAHVERDPIRIISATAFTNISTHTLTWSVTRSNGKTYAVCEHFNSHAHVERDWQKIPIYTWKNISTHTLTWSVTCHGIVLDWIVFYFNSHAHVERDHFSRCKNCK